MNDTVEIYLPGGLRPVLLDFTDFREVWQRFRWVVVRGYVWTMRQPRIQLGQMILRACHPLMPDHINLDTFDNRRANLRLATKAENARNRGKQSTPASSRFKGVCWDRQMHKWRATICLSGSTTFLGLFDDETRAAEAYNTAALLHFGEFANLNNLQERD